MKRVIVKHNQKKSTIVLENNMVTIIDDNREDYFAPAHFGCDKADTDEEIIAQVVEWLDGENDRKEQQTIINDIINGDIITDGGGV